jgi:hypothetical protein
MILPAAVLKPEKGVARQQHSLHKRSTQSDTASLAAETSQSRKCASPSANQPLDYERYCAKVTDSTHKERHPLNLPLVSVVQSVPPPDVRTSL